MSVAYAEAALRMTRRLRPDLLTALTGAGSAAGDIFFIWDESTSTLKSITRTELVTALGVVTDHGALSGLADDDHTQYSRADGTRAFTGVVSGITPTLAAHLATKGYADSLLTDLAVGETLILSGVITPTQLSADTDDWAPTGLADATIIRTSTDASRTLTGLTGGAAGRLILLWNVGSNALVLSDQDASSTAANRFALEGAENATIAAGGARLLCYDGTASRWRVVGGGAGGGSGGATSYDVAQAGHGLTVGECIRHNGTSWVVSDNGDGDDAEVMAMVSAVADTDNFSYVLPGQPVTTSGLTAGEDYYLGSAGAITATAPTATGTIRKPVGFAISTTVLIFSPQLGVENTAALEALEDAVTAVTITTRADSTVYAQGTTVVPITGNGFYYEYTTGGTSAGSPPTYPTTVGDTVADGTGVLTCRQLTPGKQYSVALTTRDYTLSLPAVAQDDTLRVGVDKDSTYLLTIDGDGGETIDGATTRIMWRREWATIKGNDGEWQKIYGLTIPMSCCLKRTTAQSISNDTWTQIQTTTVVYDNTSALASPMGDTSNGRARILRPGRYIGSGYASITGLSSGNLMAGGCGKSSASPADNPNATVGVPSPSTGDQNANGTGTWDCVAGDWIAAICYQNSGSAKNTRTPATVQPTVSVIEVPTW